MIDRIVLSFKHFSIYDIQYLHFRVRATKLDFILFVIALHLVPIKKKKNPYKIVEIVKDKLLLLFRRYIK